MDFILRFSLGSQNLVDYLASLDSLNSFGCSAALHGLPQVCDLLLPDRGCEHSRPGDIQRGCGQHHLHAKEDERGSDAQHQRRPPDAEVWRESLHAGQLVAKVEGYLKHSCPRADFISFRGYRPRRLSRSPAIAPRIVPATEPSISNSGETVRTIEPNTKPTAAPSKAPIMTRFIPALSLHLKNAKNWCGIANARKDHESTCREMNAPRARQVRGANRSSPRYLFPMARYDDT